jgi:hypothetical protein
VSPTIRRICDATIRFTMSAMLVPRQGSVNSANPLG